MADIVRITNLRGGLITDSPSYLLAPNEFRVLKNLFIRGVERQASLRLRSGNRLLFSTSGDVNGLTRYRNETLSRLVYGLGSAILSRNESNGDTTTIGVGSGLVGGENEFAQMLGYLFWVDGLAAAQMWSGSGASGLVGVTPPNAPIADDVSDYSLLPSGPLDSYNRPPYKWVMTYVTADGIESNPSPESISIEALLKSVDFDAGVIPVSSDPRVTTKNIYRIGGRLTVYTLVGSIPNATTTFLDDTGDLDVGTIQLSYSHDMPPGGAEDIIVWKNRLVLSKVYTLYVSNLGEPWYFPETITNPDTDGRIFDVDPSYENPIVALSNSGSALIILCAKSVHYLMGDTTDSFSLVKVGDIGCVSRRCAVQCGSITVWMAPDKMVYAMTADGIQPIGLDIEKTLRSIPSSSLSSACACYYRQQYHLCVPQLSGIPTVDTYNPPYYFVYDFRYGKWVDLSTRYMAATLLYAETGVSDTDEILLATHDPYFDVGGNELSGVIAAFGSGVQRLEFDAHFGDFDDQSPMIKKRLAACRIRGKFSGENGSAIFHASQTNTGASPVTQTTSKAYPLVSGEGIIFSRDLDSSLIGQRVSLQIKGIASTIEIDDVWATIANTGTEGN